MTHLLPPEGTKTPSMAEYNATSKRIGVVRGDAGEQVGQPVGDARADDHAEDDGIERELDQHAAGGRNALGNRPHEALGPPVQQQAGGDEHQVVGVQVERGQRALRRGAEDDRPGTRSGAPRPES